MKIRYKCPACGYEGRNDYQKILLDFKTMNEIECPECAGILDVGQINVEFSGYTSKDIIRTKK
jgi:predicted RNA-binding Zn-ribbon protein involved in translation (DUF1610 family)